MSFYSGVNNLANLIQNFGTDAAPVGYRVMTALNNDFQLNYNQLHAARYNSRFHFANAQASIHHEGFFSETNNWLNAACKAGFAPMSRNLLCWASTGTYELDYNSDTRQARWWHSSGNNTGRVNQVAFSCPPCVIIAAQGNGGNGGSSIANLGYLPGNGASRGAGGGLAVVAVNLSAINSGSGWRICLRFVIRRGTGRETNEARESIRVYRMEGSSWVRAFHVNSGMDGQNTERGTTRGVSFGGGTHWVTTNDNTLIRRMGHTTAVGSATANLGRSGANGGGSASNGSNFTNNIFTSYGINQMGRLNQSAVSSNYGIGGLPDLGGSSTSNGRGGGGGASCYGNGGHGGRVNNTGIVSNFDDARADRRGRNGVGFGGGGGGAATTSSGGQGGVSGGTGSNGIIAIYS